MKSSKSIPILTLGALILWSCSVYASGCSEYPYSPGEISYEETAAGPKILATGAATVEFDDADEVLDATKEATMEAKAAISKFFNETIQSDESIDTASQTTIKLIESPSGDQKTATKDKVKITLKRLASQSSSLLRGVVKLAECYDKGEKVLVSVGMKPETIAVAESATGAINKSFSKASNTKSANSNAPHATSTNLQGNSTKGPESYTKGIDKMNKF